MIYTLCVRVADEEDFSERCRTLSVPLPGFFSLTHGGERASALRQGFLAAPLLPRAAVRVLDASERVPALHSAAAAACSSLGAELRSGNERADLCGSAAPTLRFTPRPLSPPHAEDITRLLKAWGVIALIRHRRKITYFI